MTEEETDEEMDSFKSIMVDIDATASAHPALERAVLLAERSGAKLTVVDVVTVPTQAHQYLPAGIEEGLVRDRGTRLTQLARGVREVHAEPKLLIGRPGTMLIEEVLRSNHDLIMRSHAHELSSSTTTPFGAVDMELLRKCPCPVFLVRHGQPATKPRIACAVDASREETQAQALNAKLVESALLLADYLMSDSPILFHAWVPYAERLVRSHVADDQFAAYLDSLRTRATSALAGIAQSFGGRLGARKHRASAR